MATSSPLLNMMSYHHLKAQQKEHSTLLPDQPMLLHGATSLMAPATAGYPDDCCTNGLPRQGLWLLNPASILPPTYQPVGFLSLLGQVCIAAKVRACRHRECQKRFERMSRYAPPCAWREFRHWALVAMSCHEGLALACKDRLESQGARSGFTALERFCRTHTHIVHAVHACYAVLDASRARQGRQMGPIHDGFLEPRIEVRSVCNLIYWMVNIVVAYGVPPSGMARWDGYYIPRAVAMPAIEKAACEIRHLKLCSCRFWNLVDVAERKQSDLPDLMCSLRHTPRHAVLQHHGHDDCAPTRCQTAHMDSTRTTQMHKCDIAKTPSPSKECPQARFPVDHLIAAVELGEGTAWSCRNEQPEQPKQLSAPDAPYIAISHVWSDGTGVGVSEQGLVNSCLFEYFARIAKRLDCEGIWWDAVSLPVERRSRSKALNQMHKNYADAAYTVLHDSYLLQIPADDPETACLGIVLSPWFTRGWTAVELRMASRVKVLLKGQNDDTPAIKDLDEDLLAPNPGACSRVHWLASRVIRRLRTEAIEYVDDVLAVLNPRQTSRVRDRTTIAGLLTGIPHCDYSQSEAEVTKSILFYLGFVSHASLLHGRPTMCETGPFSWSPASLDEMPISARVDDDDPDARRARMLRIEDGGAIVGRWYARPVTERQVQDHHIEPHGSHVSVAVSFYSALLEWENCLILRESERDTGPAVLAVTVPTNDQDRGQALECRYVGAARIREDDGSVSEGASHEVWVRMGGDQGKQGCNARETVEKWLHSRSKEEERPRSPQQKPLDEKLDGNLPVQSLDPGEDRTGRDSLAALPPWFIHAEIKCYTSARATGSLDANDRDATEGDEDDSQATDPTEDIILKAFKHPRALQILQVLVAQGVTITDEVKAVLGVPELTTLSVAYHANNLQDLAKQACESATEMLPAIIDDPDRSTMEAMCTLGKICWETGLLNEAAGVYSHVISSRKPDEIQDKRLRLQALGELSLLHSQTGAMQQASERYIEALKQIHGPKNLPDMIYVFSHDALTRLGKPCSRRDADDRKMKGVYSKALRVFERELGKEHAVTQITAQNLAATLFSQGEIWEAEEILRDVEHCMEKIAGREHPLTLRARYDLARIHILQGRTTTPEHLSTLSKEIQTILGQEHWLVRLSRLTIAGLLERNGKLSEAIQLLNDAPETASTSDSRFEQYLSACRKRDLGIFYMMEPDSEKAKEQLQSADGQFKVLELTDHLGAYVTDFCLAVLKDEQGQRGECDAHTKMFQPPLSGMERVCGPTYPETREVISQLARLCAPRVKNEIGCHSTDPTHVMVPAYRLRQLLWRYGDIPASDGRANRAFPPNDYNQVFGSEMKEAHYRPHAIQINKLATEDNEIVVKNAAVSLDGLLDEDDGDDEDYEQWDIPTTVTHDIAGTVVKVGSQVTGFQEGDRVLAQAMYPFTREKRHIGFRNYTVVPSHLAALIPASASFESAVVLPFGVSTAAVALFHKLGVSIDSLSPTVDEKPAGKVLVWGGTTTTGCNAIQLGRAAGCEIITTTLAKDFDYVRRLGASQVVDIRSPKVEEELVEAMRGGMKVLGAIRTDESEHSQAICTEVLKKVGSGQVIATSQLPAGLFNDPELGRKIYGDFLPRMLNENKYILAPDPVTQVMQSRLLGTLQDSHKVITLV